MATKVQLREIKVLIITVESPEGDVYNLHDIIEWDDLIHQIAITKETGWKVIKNERLPEAIGEIELNGRVNGLYIFDEFSQMLASKIRLANLPNNMSREEKLTKYLNDTEQYFEGKYYEYVDIL